MSILLYVKLIQCSDIPSVYGVFRRRDLIYVHSAICETYLVQWYSIDLWSIGGSTSALSICAFCYMLNLFSVVVFYRYMVNWGRGALVYVHSAICETYLVQWLSIDLWSIGGGTSALNICSFCYMLKLFCTVVFYRYMVNWGRGPWYTCFVYMLNIFGEVVFHRCIVNWRRGALVYVHSVICEMHLVQWYSIDLWSIGGGGLGICSGIPQIYAQLEEGGLVYVHSAIC